VWREQRPPADMTYIGYIDIANIGDRRHIADMGKEPILTIKKLIAIAPVMAKSIEDYRFKNRIASESEAIRCLIELGLKAPATQVLSPKKRGPKTR
jgi:hypothetical protein